MAIRDGMSSTAPLVLADPDAVASMPSAANASTIAARSSSETLRGSDTATFTFLSSGGLDYRLCDYDVKRRHALDLRVYVPPDHSPLLPGLFVIASYIPCELLHDPLAELAKPLQLDPYWYIVSGSWCRLRSADVYALSTAAYFGSPFVSFISGSTTVACIAIDVRLTISRPTSCHAMSWSSRISLTLCRYAAPRVSITCFDQ